MDPHFQRVFSIIYMYERIHLYPEYNYTEVLLSTTDKYGFHTFRGYLALSTCTYVCIYLYPEYNYYTQYYRQVWIHTLFLYVRTYVGGSDQLLSVLQLQRRGGVLQGGGADQRGGDHPVQGRRSLQRQVPR